jgi:hypothetical protein
VEIGLTPAASLLNVNDLYSKGFVRISACCM